MNGGREEKFPQPQDASERSQEKCFLKINEFNPGLDSGPVLHLLKEKNCTRLQGEASVPLTSYKQTGGGEKVF